MKDKNTDSSSDENKELAGGSSELERQEQGLGCAMCGAVNSFVISPLDPAVGYCFKEQQAWRITSTTCATEGCWRQKAAFGDHCMLCLENRVNAPEAGRGDLARLS